MRAEQGRRAMGERPAGWTETDSQRFIDDGAVFVPSRDEQIATLCALIPARADEADRDAPSAPRPGGRARVRPRRPRLARGAAVAAARRARLAGRSPLAGR